MKRFLILFGIMIFCAESFAQCIHFSISGGAGSVNTTDRRAAGVFGFDLGYENQNGFDFGVYFSGAVTGTKYDSRLEGMFDDCEFKYRMFYGGGYFDKVLYRNSVFYASAGVKVGFGGANYSNDTVEKEIFDFDDDDEEYVSGVVYEKADKCFVMALEPFVSANFKVNDFLVLSACAEYRNLLFTNLHYGGLHIAGGSDLNGVSFLAKVTFVADF